MPAENSRRWGLITVGSAAAVLVLAASAYYLLHARPAAHAAGGPAEHATEAAARVEVATPQKGGLERTSKQPGTLIAFESANLYSKVPGFLAAQSVDIGTKVKKGEELARIAVPEYEKQVLRDAAAVEQALAAVKQNEAKVTSTEADLKAAEAGVAQAQAAQASAESTHSFREKQYQRIKALFQQNSIDERLVDEKDEQRDAAQAAENAAKASVITARSMVSAAQAKILQAKADLLDAKAKVEVARADLEKAKVWVDYSHIKSEYDGVITHRNYFPGDYVASTDTASRTPVLAVDRTDKLRVVVQVPDRDVPFTHPGDLAVIDIDALPGKPYKGAVARIADSEDPATRTMRVEIDLDNPKDELRSGMYGQVTIILSKGAATSVSIPSAALVGEGHGGDAKVFVVRDGKARLTAIRIGSDNGVRSEVLSGLTPDDQVIVHFAGAVEDGTPVTVVDRPATSAAPHKH